LSSWITELRQNSHPELRIFLIGNKNDLSNERQVTVDEAINFMHKNNIDFFEETSAKEGFNIEEIFKKAIILLYSGYLKYLETNPSNNSNLNTANSIYATINSKNFTLQREDPEKIKDKNESDLVDKNSNKSWSCAC